MKSKALLILSLLMLAGCGGMDERTDYKDGAVAAPPLDVPPDLVLPPRSDRYNIPASSKPDVTGSSNNESSASLRDLPGGGQSILLAEPFDRCWFRVAQGLDDAGVAVEDKDRSKGLFYLKGGHSQVSVQTVKTGCEVAANDGSGKVSDETENVIKALYKKLGH